jgi:hypothetical protein
MDDKAEPAPPRTYSRFLWIALKVLVAAIVGLVVGVALVALVATIFGVF